MKLPKFLLPPEFDNEDDNTKARLLNGFAWLTISVLIIAIILILGTGFVVDSTVYVLSGLIVVFALALILLKLKRLATGSILVTALAWIGITYQAYSTGGMRDVIVIAYIAVTLIASLLINLGTAILVFILSLGSIWVLAALELNGIISPSFDTLPNHARDLSLIFIVIASLIYFATNSLRRVLNHTRKIADELSVSNQELMGLRIDLENRVDVRTAELAELTKRSETRANLLRTIAEVARSAVAIKEIEELLPSITLLISDRFGYYHVGIFIPDENQNELTLVAANSEGGLRMLQRQHKLEISPSSIIGYAAANLRPRIALDVGSDAVFFNNPDLPNTSSEMALPLLASGQLIGVLDVQSTETNAFSQEDIELLNILADQLTVAIENARLFQETRQALNQAESFYQRYVGKAWHELASQLSETGYHYEKGKSSPIEQRVPASTAANSGHLVQVPLQVSGRKIGILIVQPNNKSRVLSPEEQTLLTGVAERVALALENARLLEDAQRRASQERALSDASARMRENFDVESVLKSAAQELHSILGNIEAEVWVSTDDTEDI